MATRATQEIREQVRELMAWFPGRYRFAWLWLLVVPTLLAMMQYFAFAQVLQVKWGADDDPLGFVVLRFAGTPSLCMVYVGAFLVLGRGYRSRPRSWAAIATLVGSSWIYATILSLAFFVVSWILAWVMVGALSLASVLITLWALLLAYGGLALILAALALLIRFIPIAAPVFAVAILSYGTQIAIPFPYGIFLMIPVEALIPWAPLFAVTEALRDGLTGGGYADSIHWLPPLIHAVLGYASLCWFLLRSASENESA